MDVGIKNIFGKKPMLGALGQELGPVSGCLKAVTLAFQAYGLCHLLPIWDCTGWCLSVQSTLGVEALLS